MPFAFVTGGSRGIGRAIVERLARDGFDVALNYRREDAAADDAVAAVRACGRTGVALKCDLGDPAEVAGIGERKLAVVTSMLADLGAETSLDDLAARYEVRQKNDREKLDSMIAYAQSALCRWQLILRQFGETIDGDACGDCDNCRRNQSRQQLPAAS